MDRHQVFGADRVATVAEVALPAGARACKNLQVEDGITMDRAPVSSHRNPETGAVIEVRPAEDVPSSRNDRDSWPWITLCVDHDMVRYHKTWADASVAMRRPLFSCAAC